MIAILSKREYDFNLNAESPMINPKKDLQNMSSESFFVSLAEKEDVGLIQLNFTLVELLHIVTTATRTQDEILNRQQDDGAAPRDVVDDDLRMETTRDAVEFISRKAKGGVMPNQKVMGISVICSLLKRTLPIIALAKKEIKSQFHLQENTLFVDACDAVYNIITQTYTAQYSGSLSKENQMLNIYDGIGAGGK